MRAPGVLLLALAMALAGCVSLPSQGGDQLSGASTNATQDAGHGNASAPGAIPLDRAWDGAATVGAPYQDNAGASTATVVKQALDGGLNGTFVLGYNFTLQGNDTNLTVKASAPAGDPSGTTPDYDLYLFGPDGSLLGSSTNPGTNEIVALLYPDQGTYTVALLYWAGGPSPASGTVHVTVQAR